MATANSGLGAGDRTQELEAWLRDAGRITVIEEGEQMTLAGGSVRMYRLFNSAGESRLLSAEVAEAYGYRPREIRKARPEARPNLFDTQEVMF